MKRTDKASANLLAGAKFALYRPATEEELDGSVETMKLGDPEVDYVMFGEEQTTGEDGIVSFAEIAKLESGNYYLVETYAPVGFLKAAPIKVNLTVRDKSFTPVPPGTTPQTDRPEDDPYKWTQVGALTLEDAPNLRRVGESGDSLSQADLNAITENSDTLMVYYKLTDNAGARLPATGGPGTTMFYVTGIGLIALAVLLLLRKREKETL